MEKNLLNRSIDARIHAESQAERQAFGTLIRDRVIELIADPRLHEPGPYDYLVETKGAKLLGEIKAGELTLPFELDADDVEVHKSSEVSIAIEGLGEKLLLRENGDAELQKDEAKNLFRPNSAQLSDLADYYGYLGLIESQLRMANIPTPTDSLISEEMLPPNVVPITKGE